MLFDASEALVDTHEALVYAHEVLVLPLEQGGDVAQEHGVLLEHGGDAFDCLLEAIDAWLKAHAGFS
jgi:hypothetical protein